MSDASTASNELTGLLHGLGAPDDVAARPRGWRPRLRGVVARRGDLQRAADRLDPEFMLVLIDELGHLLDGRSSSAAKKADADFKI